jgi:hypothetical protein
LLVWSISDIFFSGNYSDGDNNSSSSSRGKKRTLEELFKPPLDIMFKGDWQSVRDAATAAKKWLIVNVQVRTLNAFLFEVFFRHSVANIDGLNWLHLAFVTEILDYRIPRNFYFTYDNIR